MKRLQINIETNSAFVMKPAAGCVSWVFLGKEKWILTILGERGSSRGSRILRTILIYHTCTYCSYGMSVGINFTWLDIGLRHFTRIKARLWREWKKLLPNHLFWIKPSPFYRLFFRLKIHPATSKHGRVKVNPRPAGNFRRSSRHPLFRLRGHFHLSSICCSRTVHGSLADRDPPPGGQKAGNKRRASRQDDSPLCSFTCDLSALISDKYRRGGFHERLDRSRYSYGQYIGLCARANDSQLHDLEEASLLLYS